MGTTQQQTLGHTSPSPSQSATLTILLISAGSDPIGARAVMSSWTHTPPALWSESSEQRAESKEQRAESSEQRAASKELRAKSLELRAELRAES